MKIKDLQQKLLEAYTLKNLNNISLTLINLYKNEQFSILQKITEIIGDYVDVDIAVDGKGFSKLIMLYHPDRIHYHINEINKLTEQNNFDGLLEYSHILKLERIDEITNSLDSFEDIDYSPVYEWDIDTEGFSIIKDSDPVKEVTIKRKKYNFYDAIKIRQFGHTEIEFPSYYLEDLDEFELSASDINDLDGVQFCKHAKSLDLSDNHITDLTPLIGLAHLEEINLSENKIENIEALRYLTNLKKVNLSVNSLDDISSLFKLCKLEYVDVTGNKINVVQINKLIEMGIAVDY
jgi:Leucine Rich repeats (2 copies)